METLYSGRMSMVVCNVFGSHASIDGAGAPGLNKLENEIRNW